VAFGCHRLAIRNLDSPVIVLLSSFLCHSAGFSGMNSLPVWIIIISLLCRIVAFQLTQTGALSAAAPYVGFCAA
jgi:hypothetical protein